MSIPVQIDSSALTEPLDRAAYGAYRRVLSGPRGRSVSTIAAVVYLAAVVLFAAILTFIAQANLLAGLIGFGVLAFIAANFTVRFLRTLFVNVRRDFRLSRFAERNGLRFERRITAPDRPGMIFDRGSERFASAVLHADDPRPIEFAEYQYSTGSENNTTLHPWHYAAVRLEHRLPNIVLDARSNDLFGSNLPARFRRDQQLSLEGDFDRHFQLYCPAGYETDALYLFTPDVMATLIDTAGAFDVEIVDDWVFLYTKGRPDLLDPATWEREFRATRAVLEKIGQWERWRDDRLAPDPAARAAAIPGPSPADPPAPVTDVPQPIMDRPEGVSREGKRLDRRFSRGVIIALVAVGALWLFAMIPWLLRFFTG